MHQVQKGSRNDLKSKAAGIDLGNSVEAHTVLARAHRVQSVVLCGSCNETGRCNFVWKVTGPCIDYVLDSSKAFGSGQVIPLRR